MLEPLLSKSSTPKKPVHLSFLESQREELEAELTDPGIHPRSLDEMEIHSLTKITQDIQEHL
jgi:hypothetical protein